MKKLLLLFLFVIPLASFSQLTPQWVNHFCCFDTTALHSFSYPVGIIQNQDSGIVAYFEDDSMKIKIVDLVSGNDLVDFYYTTYNTLPAFNYGGDFVKCHEGYLITFSSMDLNGNYYLSFYIIDNSFTLLSANRVRVSSAQTLPTKLANASSDTSFFIAYLSDSLHLINVNTSANTIQNYSYQNIYHELYPEMFLNSSNELILMGRIFVGNSTFMIQLKRIDPMNGNVIQTEDIPAAGNYSHACFADQDSLFIAHNNRNVGDVNFLSVDMNTLVASTNVNTGQMDFYSVINFASDHSGGKYYIETYEKLIQVNPDHTIGFVRDLMSRSFEVYNGSPLLFDDDDNPIVFYSYINNGVVDDDLKAIRIDKNNSSTIDSFIYDDIRHTTDIAITQFFDNNNRLNLVFANDYDDAFILQEETQLNIIHLNALTNSIEKLSETDLVYPNPASDKIYFKNDLSISKVRLCDMSGREVKNFGKDFTGGLDVSGISSGIYILKILFAGDRMKSFKIIIL